MKWNVNEANSIIAVEFPTPKSISSSFNDDDENKFYPAI